MSVRKRIRGGRTRWEVRYRQGTSHRSQTFDTRQEALDFDGEQRKRRRMGAFGPSDPSAELLVDYSRRWFDRECNGWAKSTRLNRGHLIDRWIIPYIGNDRLMDLGQPRVREWRAKIEKDGAKTVTANRALGTLSACLGHAVRDGKLPLNPCSGVEKRREVVSRPRVLSPVEVEKIRRRMPSERDAVLVALMSLAGLRPAEAFALRWADIGNLLVVDRSYTYGQMRPTKTGSRRTIDIIDVLREDLHAFRDPDTTDGDLVAPNRQGRPLDLRTWRRRIWRPAIERAGVEANPYDLRHAYCSLLAHEGRSAPYIAAMMGHSLTDTQKHYAHLIDDARLATGTTMVDAVREARAKVKVRPRYAQPQQRHLHVVAESA